MALLQAARPARFAPLLRPQAAAWRCYAAPALQPSTSTGASASMVAPAGGFGLGAPLSKRSLGFGTPLSKRNARVSVLGCAIAMVAIGGYTQGMGQLLAAPVEGTAHTPSMKELIGN
mmetsp:Transcript_149031/g.379135  ORF Transcript_149031/g.379135 Transcript_149031/m.379135 type:complete len:117 (+) Transcript_149031:65-415(+)|eukprot:CAMPEP_0115413050 /NCGR_PEP_ID=MMETSP0271-20121206/21871_1 /TAXON_ID=71861 /ORGANISM="Scrippsiella trochoidea, Strain CCMP3099" /LENGTH=116 /DNA_ID=CAMNT_0002837319 /DNA_START=56 /DNA_END=406 /DNA_ORIENTATION=+